MALWLILLLAFVAAFLIMSFTGEGAGNLSKVGLRAAARQPISFPAPHVANCSGLSDRRLPCRPPAEPPLAVQDAVSLPGEGLCDRARPAAA